MAVPRRRRLSWRGGRSSGAPTRELIYGDRENHQDAGDQHLIDRVYAGKLEPVAEDADDQGADKRPDHVASAAEKAGAAEDDGGDAGEIVCLAGLGVADLRPSNQHQTGYAID